jgi:hypothetical protein
MHFFEKVTSNNITYKPDSNLDSLANELELDKGTVDSKTLSWGNVFTSHYTWGYTQIYEKYMSAFRESSLPITFFEIGIADPRFAFGSIKLWLSYFKNINLYCLDNFDNETNGITVMNNIQTVTTLGANFFYGNQGVKEDWDFIENRLRNSVDFLVEDGSHTSHHMMYSLWRSIPLLKSGAYYFMEDIQDPVSMFGPSNVDVYHTLVNFKNTGKFISSVISEQACRDIERAFDVVEMYVGGQEHTKIQMCVLKKK